MSSLRSIPAAYVCLLWGNFIPCTFLVMAHEVSAQSNGKDFSSLELHTTTIGRSPLPYQSMRILISLENRGKKPVSGIDLFGFAFGGIRGPGEEHFRGIASSMNQDPHADHGGSNSRPGELICAVQEFLVLKPGERETRTQALPAGFQERPYFDRPGHYLLRAKYFPDAENTDPREAIFADTLTIVVPKPHGEEAALYRILQEKPALAMEMMSACTLETKVPIDTVVGDLESVVQKYARTTYADYARFALARAYLGGIQKARIAQADKKAKALPLLEAIDLKTFPYASSVLLWIKIVRNNPKDSARIDARLDEEFHDDETWVTGKQIPLGMSWLEEVLPKEQRWSEKYNRKPEATLYGDAEEMASFIGGHAAWLSKQQIEVLRKKVGRERGPRPVPKPLRQR